MKTIKSVLILLAGLIIGLYFGKKRCDAQYVIQYLPSDTIFITDSFPVPYMVEVVKEVPKIYYQDKVVYKTDTVLVVQEIDTLKVLEEFFKRKYYDQELLSDSTGYIRLQQTVAMNSIESQTLTYLPPQQKIITYSPKKIRYGIGADYRFSKDVQDVSIKGGILYQDRHHIEVGYSKNGVTSIGYNFIFK